MAVVNHTHDRRQLYTWEGLSASDTGDPIFLSNGWGVVCTITCVDGGGTGFNSGTLTMQVSNDNTNWMTLADIHNTDVEFTANGVFEVSTIAQYIRPSCDANIGDVDVKISFG